MDTGALRATAGQLRAVGAGTAEMGGRSGGLAILVPAVGSHAAAQPLNEFIQAWSYGLGVLGHDVAVLAGTLDGAAAAFETIETELAGAASQMAVPDSCVPTRVVGATPIPPWQAPLPAPPEGSLRWGGLPSPGLEVQLSAATHPRQLVPGEPDDVEAMAASFRRFAVDSAETAYRLRRATLGGWAGQAAAAFAVQVAQAPAALDLAADAFGIPARALSGHAGVLAAAQEQAASALRLWQDAEYRSKVARGAVVGASPTPSGGDDADADLARAAAMVRTARDEVDVSARALRTVLAQASAGAPRNPGLLARLAAGIRSFGAGAGEGTAAMVAGAAGIVALAARLNPARAAIDPQGYLDTLGSAVDAAGRAGSQPWDTAKPRLDPVGVLADVNDTVRYTVGFDETGYAVGQRALTDLRAHGFEELKVGNSWDGERYRGINSTWRDPETGQVFEVQFHTADSFQAKMDTHHWYEEQRLSATPRHRQEELQEMQNEVFAGVPHPPAAESVTRAYPVPTGRARTLGGAVGTIGAHAAAGTDRLGEECETLP